MNSALINLDGELISQLDEIRERLRKRGDCRASYSCAVRELLKLPHKNCRNKASYRPIKFERINREADMKEEVYRRLEVVKKNAVS